MEFNWTKFNEKSFMAAMDELQNSMEGEIYFGSVRVGNLCFDIMTREYDERIALDYDLYAGGIDTGYGYSDEYPYDYVGGGSFDESCVDMTYEEFMSYAEKVLEEYIRAEETAYSHASLIEKANAELNLW